MVSHAHELGPVAAEASGVNPRLHHEPPAGAAGTFLTNGSSGLALRHVAADVDDLHQQQVKHTSRHDGAVPHTGET